MTPSPRPSPTLQSPSDFFVFGDFKLTTNPLNLSRFDGPVALQPQPTRLLVLLVERRGTIVTRDQIRDELWPNGAFLDHEQAINFAIRKIRIALGDQAGSPQFVETLPRLGYRFIAEVQSPVSADVQSPAISPSDRPPKPTGSTAEPASPRLLTPPRRNLASAHQLKLSAIALLLISLVPMVVSLEIFQQNAIETSRPPLHGQHDFELDTVVVPHHYVEFEAASDVETNSDYLQGRYLVEQDTEKEVRLGISKLRLVVTRYPYFAPAHYALALGFFRVGQSGHHFSSYMPVVQEKVTRALELDPDHPESHALLAIVHFFYNHDWQAAERMARRSIDLDDQSPDAWQLLAVILAARGETNEGVTLVQKALALDPAELLVRSDLAYCLMYDHRYTEALNAAQVNLGVAPDDRINLFLDASLRYRLGDYEASLISFQKYLETWGVPRAESLDAVFERLLDLFEQRRHQGSRAHLPLALVHVLQGDSNTALDLLIEACDHDPDWELPMLNVDPRFDSIRELPSYEKLRSCFPPRQGPDWQ